MRLLRFIIGEESPGSRRMSAMGNTHLRRERERIRATETSPLNAGVKRGNLCVEQGQIGDERLSLRDKNPGLAA